MNMDEPEESSYESTTSGSPEVKQRRRWFSVPSVKGFFMFVGVVMIIGVLGMAGYIFYKGPDAKAKRLVASNPATSLSGYPRAEEDGPVPFTGSEPMSPKKAKAPVSKRTKKKRSVPAAPNKAKKNKAKKGQKRRSTHPTMGPQNAPLEAEANDDEADDGEKADGAATPPDVAANKDDSAADDVRNAHTLFNGDPSCTTTHDLYKCEGDEQLQMFLSHLCLSNSKGASCFQWQPQQLCLTSQTNRFRTLQDCQDKCNGNQNCGMAATCQCSGMYRKVNYIYDMRRQRCRLIPLHECVEVNVGFVDNDECQSVCGRDTAREDSRCKLAALEELVHPCMWEDKLYTHYYDAKSGQCQPWGESVCSSTVFRRLVDCFKECPRGAIVMSPAQPGNATGNVRRIVRVPQQVKQKEKRRAP